MQKVKNMRFRDRLNSTLGKNVVKFWFFVTNDLFLTKFCAKIRQSDIQYFLQPAKGLIVEYPT